MWYLVSPLIMAAVIILRWINTDPMKYDDDALDENLMTCYVIECDYEYCYF